MIVPTSVTSGSAPSTAVLAAAAQAAGARALVSADSGFAEVPAIEHVLPDAAGVAALIG